MSKVRNENYIAIQGWMINELKLKGNELIIYAAIYGFSQTENQVFNGSLQYLADWTNSTKQGVIKNLKSLVDKGYIVKEEKYINNVKFCEYYVTKFNEVLNKVEQGIKQSLPPSVKQSLPNNIDLDTKDDINNKKERKKEDYNSIINELVNDDDVKDALLEFIKMRKLIKKPLTDRALKQLITKLFSLSSKKEEQIQILDNSIINNWASVYPLKKETYSKQPVRKEMLPEWFNKDLKNEPMTKEDEKELDTLIKELQEDIKNMNIDDDFEKEKKELQELLKSKY